MENEEQPKAVHKGLKKGLYVIPTAFTAANIAMGFIAVLYSIRGYHFAFSDAGVASWYFNRAAIAILLFPILLILVIFALRALRRTYRPPLTAGRRKPRPTGWRGHRSSRPRRGPSPTAGRAGCCGAIRRRSRGPSPAPPRS